MYESDSEEKALPNITDQTYVKPVRTEKSLPRNTHPPYMQMIHESIGTLSTHGKAVSRTKIVDYMKDKYSLNDVSNPHMSRALKIALEKNIIENTTASGAMGSFKLTKQFKEQQKSQAKALTKKDSKSKLAKSTKADEKEKKTTATKSKTSNKDEVFETEDNKKDGSVAPQKKSKSSANKKTEKRKPTNEDDDEENNTSEEEEEVAPPPKSIKSTTKRPSAKTSKSSEGGGEEQSKKKTTKKPPTGKENKSKETTAASSDKKILKEKIKSMKKATSAPALKEVEENLEELQQEIVEKPKRGRKPKQ